MAKKFDRHHLFFSRRDYSKGYARALREHWYFLVEIPKDTLHAQIHHEVPLVPLPRGGSAKSAYEQVIMLENYGALHKTDSIEKRLRLLISLFDCIEPETAKAFKKQLQVVQEFNHKTP